MVTSIRHWEAPDWAPPLGKRDVHVWWAPVQSVTGRWLDAADMLEVLDKIEHDRLARLRRSPDRARFLAGCLLLRLAVAAYQSRHPRDVVIVRTCDRCGRPHGKPRLAHGDLQLSMSHSGNRVVVAVARSTAVGVDVEQLRSDFDPSELAARVLAPTESMTYATVPTGEQQRSFLAYWTRKEAVLKATGEGLVVPLTDIVVSAPADHPRLLSWGRRPHLVGHTALRNLNPGHGHVASLAVIGPPALQVAEMSALSLLNVAEPRGRSALPGSRSLDITPQELL